MMAKRSYKANQQPTNLQSVETQSKSRKDKVLHSIWASVSRVIGLVVIVMSATMYVQLVPLVMVFIGGYMGIQSGEVTLNMDLMIWLITGIALVVPMIYIFIQWMKYIWSRFVTTPYPIPTFFSNITTKKHT